MKTLYITLLLFFSFTLGGYSQDNSTDMIRGQVLESSPTDDSAELPLISANIFWLNTSFGSSSDMEGRFEIQKNAGSDQLVISYTGYQSDTILVTDNQPLIIRLKSAVTLDEVKVTYRKKSTEISTIAPIKMEQISEGELRKAACCNLSESFGTTPSVDVSFTDAVTGTRQIRMLGLASPYTSITRENMPGIRGLNTIMGLSFIPGPWVQSMQLSKGAGSVINGYESIAGQINIELKKPELTDRLHLNVYANEGGRGEVNANLAHRINDKWSSGLFLHGSTNSIEHDRNNDQFLDHPLGQNFAAINRWKYNSGKNIEAQFGVSGTLSDHTGGQLGYDGEQGSVGNALWGMTRQVRRIEGWAKIGRLSPLPWKSMGLQLSASLHEDDNQFGNTVYDARQTSLYANYIFQSILWNTNHGIRLGGSVQYDDYEQVWESDLFSNKEIVPGIYGEYSFKYLENMDLVAGLRVDHHNQYGTFVTPRLHLRFAPSDGSVWRASIGRGQRTAIAIAENFGLLASSREWLFENKFADFNFGLDPEIAWNFGMNFTQNFRLDYRDGNISIDAYRTDFTNRLVVDLDEGPQQVYFYNLKGKSFSNVLQAQINYELIHNLDLRLAYRWVDAKTTFKSGLKEQPLNSRHRAFANMGYTTNNDNWKFDLTVNWQGQKRLPYTASNPTEYQLDKYSPSFFMLNTQMSRLWDRFEVYVGVENILNEKQPHPILASEDPFGPYFDSSMAWGPIFGRNLYVGARYTIQ